MPPDVAPGSALDVGVTLWDPAGPGIPRMGATIFVQAVPPDGSGDATRAVAIRDWPGHYRARLGVPSGGLARVEIGVPGTMCENDVCRDSDWLFEIAGTGPPSDAPVTALSKARIELDSGTVSAGRPIDVAVTVEPNTDWDAFRLPADVVVRAHEARGPNVSTATLPLLDEAAGRYEGTITVPEGGELIFEAALDADGGDATRFGTSMTRVAVAAAPLVGGTAREGAPGAGEPGKARDEGLPTILVLLLAVAAIAGVGVMLAGFRSAGR
ncbi:MAG: hypothetical protein ACJ77F_13490 [Chloroflexota bacterium]